MSNANYMTYISRTLIQFLSMSFLTREQKRFLQKKCQDCSHTKNPTAALSEKRHFVYIYLIIQHYL